MVGRLVAGWLLILGSAAAWAAEPEVVGLRLDPAEVELAGADARFSVLVFGRATDGRELDLSSSAEFRGGEGLVQVASGGRLRGLRDGETRLQVLAGGQTATLPVRVRGAAEPRAFHFENDVEAILSRFGCNTSACHGKAEGQNGFKLSVFGYDPRTDFEALVMEGRGRRVFPADPNRSLLLTKISGRAPHGGGVRVPWGSRDYETLRGWIAAGMPFGAADAPQVRLLRAVPAERVLWGGARQQLRIEAVYADGRLVDVTELARFQSNQPGLATVDEQGLISAGDVPGQAAIMASFMGSMAVCRVLLPRPEPLPAGAVFAEANEFDRHVNAQLRKLRLPPSPRCDDAEYLRRVHLDLIGALPTPAETRRFLADARPDKRARLAEDLTARPEFADFWTMYWADALRVDRQALTHKGAYAYWEWLRKNLAARRPFDQLTAELLTAEGPLSDAPQGNLFKLNAGPGQTASMVSQVFLGVRIACAECHHHPFDRWSQTDYFGMQAFFAQVGRKAGPLGESIVVGGNPSTRHPRSGAEIRPYPLGEPMPETAPEGDRRQTLAAWLTRPENPWFARNLGNRLWAHCLGRGVVEPVDDVRDTNPPTNPELLDALGRAVVETRFDLAAVLRRIVASETYQRSSGPLPENARDEQNYSRALFKRMPAEVLLDAVCQATGVEEKFDGLPGGYRAIELWDSRVPHDFLKLFGRPVRETVCSCERNAEPSVSQVLHLMNSPGVQARLAHESGTVARLVRKQADDGALVEELYLTFYSRPPTAAERATALAHLARQGSPGRREAAEDLAWSLLNSLEFVFNH